MYRSRERAIIHYLNVMIALAERYGSEVVIADLPDYVDLGGYRIARSSLRRYVDHIVRYCEENLVDCPVRKELVPDPRRGRVALVRIDADRARSLVYELGGEVELRKQIVEEYSRKIERLGKDLRRCREQLDECRRLYRSVYEELKKLDRMREKLDRAEELERKVSELERTVENLRKRVVELQQRLTRQREAVRSLIDEFVRYLDPRRLRRCIYGWREGDEDAVCTYLLKILDIVTAGKTRALIDDFVDRWEADPSLRTIGRYGADLIRELLLRRLVGGVYADKGDES